MCHKADVLSNAYLDKSFQREVNSLRVRCQHHDKGCKWVGEVRDLQKHLDPEKRSSTEQSEQTTSEYC